MDVLQYDLGLALAILFLVALDVMEVTVYTSSLDANTTAVVSVISKTPSPPPTIPVPILLPSSIGLTQRTSNFKHGGRVHAKRFHPLLDLVLVQRSPIVLILTLVPNLPGG